MGDDIKENVETVISHFPGSSGNFLGRLIAGVKTDTQKSFYRIDTNSNQDVVALNYLDLSKINQHRVVVLHEFDKKILKHFPNAKHIAIYPYTNIGNVIYNISTKKFTPTIKNIKDQYYYLIKNWHDIIVKQKPNYTCWNYSCLKDIVFLQENLFEFDQNQINFFNAYWRNQVGYNLNIPKKSQTMQEIISQNNIENWFNEWAAIYVIYCYEYCNNILETQRQWSIDNLSLTDWQDVYNIEIQYNF